MTPAEVDAEAQAHGFFAFLFTMTFAMGVLALMFIDPGIADLPYSATVTYTGYVCLVWHYREAPWSSKSL
jgi:hypothetical protein